ncbi:hypothetical protein AC578_2181 [Pseudocercospora eumusae]|uniref:Uncharacterized protein n=1 Tax=Pseudocercospora eumusae TaxID=321146 RepID=A0A139HHB5_9PEZI|nr:hypothetical protein AC578_2181 [Pseudocercospora eumusae]
MAFPAPLGAQRPLPDTAPDDPTTLQGVLNRLDFIAHGLKFRGHSVPTHTSDMIAAVRQTRLSTHQLDRLQEIRTHCKAVSRVIKNQRAVPDRAELERNLAEQKSSVVELKSELRIAKNRIKTLESAEMFETTKNKRLEEQIAEMRERERAHAACVMPANDEERVAACTDPQLTSSLKKTLAEDYNFFARSVKINARVAKLLSKTEADPFALQRIYKPSADVWEIFVEEDSTILNLMAISTLDRLEVMASSAEVNAKMTSLLQDAGYPFPQYQKATYSSKRKELCMQASARASLHVFLNKVSRIDPSSCHEQPWCSKVGL